LLLYYCVVGASPKERQKQENGSCWRSLEGVNEGAEGQKRDLSMKREKRVSAARIVQQNEGGKSERKENGLKGVKIHDREESEVDF
jgi:IS5 family transposase